MFKNSADDISFFEGIETNWKEIVEATMIEIERTVKKLRREWEEA